ncbi:MAG: FkbM family methyltransferase [Arenicellales bacterium]|jgi:FkbM family methyltransferase
MTAQTKAPRPGIGALRDTLIFSKRLWRARRILTGDPRALWFFSETAGLNARASFRYGSLRFVSRKTDWFSAGEVLLDNEYGFIRSILDGERAPEILDVGANIGAFALYVFHLFPGARVASIEPDPDTYEILEHNNALNRSVDWRTLRGALWSGTEALGLHRTELSTGNRVREVAGDDDLLVQGYAFPELCRRLGMPNPALVKMDIEGAEQFVIPHMEPYFKDIGWLVLEVHDDRFNPDTVFAILRRSFPFIRKVVPRKSSKPLLVLSRRDVELPGTKRLSSEEQ